MKNSHKLQILTCFLAIAQLLSALVFSGQTAAKKSASPALKTPLPQELLTMLANEISGQVIFNNEVKLAGAPWLREKKEFSDTFYEAQKIYELVRSYGITTTRIDRYPRDRKFDYPEMGEFWLLKPDKRLIARLESDPALIASSSANVDLTGELIYIPPLTKTQLKEWPKKSLQEKYRDKIALMWSHANRSTAKALDAAGIKGVISFNSRERYFDPGQVIYSRGSYNAGENLKFGFSVSWRQWSELLEDVERGEQLTVRCKTHINKYPDKFETVFSWIEGTEPDKKGVIFSAHLFEGYTKRGANDNMSGCVVQLEILRALSRLIASGALPQPRRSIYFLWPNEISGTYEQFRQNRGLADKMSININMDMVGEGLRKNNAVFTVSECPNQLPSYLDGLIDSMLNYVWRTNDIVYLPDSPRGRRGGQYFPRPMWEKNGSDDAFRYTIHRATGGSDHICFNNPMVAVPGIELNIWPDQWYHADTDTPDKSDPTQMKRVGFIGAATAWAAANCTDEVAAELLSAVTAFGYQRIGARELPRIFRYIEEAEKDNLQQEINRAYLLAELATSRELGAVNSVKEIYTGSKKAQSLVKSFTRQWELYQEGINEQIHQYALYRTGLLKTEALKNPEPAGAKPQYGSTFPAIHPDVRELEFSVEGSTLYKEYKKANPEKFKSLGLNGAQKRYILNYINGKRSIVTIHRRVMAETGKDLEYKVLVRYLELLKEVGWITF